jgi:hypothetical protein
VDRNAKRILKCKNWRRSVENSDVWRRRIEEAKAQGGITAEEKTHNTLHIMRT